MGLEGIEGIELFKDVTEGKHELEETVDLSTPATPEEGAAQEESSQAKEGESQDKDGEEQTPDYGGFSTLDELIADYQSKKTEVDQLSSLKGRMGNELGEARSEKQRLLSILEGLQAEKKEMSHPANADLTKLFDQYQEGEITLDAYLAARDAAKEETLRKEVDERIKSVRSEWDKEKRVQTFIKENPGYVAAFDAGKLAEDIDAGLPGEWAWDRHQLRELRNEINAVKKEKDALVEQARKQGFELGVKVEKGKTGTAKVLGDKAGGTSFSQGKKPIAFATKEDRLAAAVSLINRMKK
uniref:Uncharacterized protein n=1 Tax=viral metagenome TaxID=1070528 RepID=A0A6M3IFF8_9ZZZZ